MNIGRPRILAIDDTPANLMVLAHALAEDYSFQIATSGREGLAMAEDCPPDIVLLDVMMPELDGNETCRIFKGSQKLKDIPIVFITALSDSSSEVLGLSLGAVDYLHKPISVPIARQRIKNIVERFSMQRELAASREQLEVLVVERTRELQQANIELTAAKVATECAIRTKANFLANISHEMYTPLSAIIGMNTLLQSNMNSTQLRISEKIEHAANQLHCIIKRILQLAALEGDAGGVDAPTEFNVRDMLNLAVAHYREQATAKGLSLSLEVSDNVPVKLQGMSAGIRQAIENFLDNAIRFSESGAICLRTEVLTAADEVITLRFEVEDDGIGIAESVVPSLFDRFTQADESTTRSHGGIGVGLAINRHLAQLMGGEIGVESKLGYGSRFWIAVPLYHFSYGMFIPYFSDDDADGVLMSSAYADQIHSLPADIDMNAEVDRLLGLLELDDVEAKRLWESAYKRLAPLLGNKLEAFSEAMWTFSFDEAREILLAVKQVKE